MNNFTKAIEFTLPWEVGKDRSGKLRQDGGYTNDPRDPGGETKWGISKKAHPELDIKNLTLEQALAIYRKDYYDAYKRFKHQPITLDDLPMPIAVAIFDTGVNCGVNRAYNWYIDAEHQSKTLDKEKALVDIYLGLRKDYYLKLKTYPIYGKGWINRLVDLSKYCEILASDASV